MESIKNKVIKVAMVGISGTGKSSFISGLNQKFITQSTNGITILPRKDSGSQSEFFSVGELSTYTPNNELGTDRTTVYKLSLKVENQIVCNFDFIDYRGGILDDMYKDTKNKEEIEVTKEYIRNSDAILVMIDTVMLSNYDKNKRIIATGADKINPLFNIFEQDMSKKGMSVLLLLSKSDSTAIIPEDKSNNFTLLANKALKTFNIVYECAKRHIDDDWNFGILPISAMGDGNSITTEVKNEAQNGINSLNVSYVSKLKDGAYPESKNIDVALLYTLTKAMESKVLYCKAKEKELENYILGLQKDRDEVNVLNGFKYRKIVSEYENKKDSKKDTKKGKLGLLDGFKFKEIIENEISLAKKELKMYQKDEEDLKNDINRILEKVNLEEEILCEF